MIKIAILANPCEAVDFMYAINPFWLRDDDIPAVVRINPTFYFRHWASGAAEPTMVALPDDVKLVNDNGKVYLVYREHELLVRGVWESLEDANIQSGRYESCLCQTGLTDTSDDPG